MYFFYKIYFISGFGVGNIIYAPMYIYNDNAI